jgi:hypothetical protein
MASMVRRGRAGVFSARFRFISVCFRARSPNAIADNHAGRTRNAPGISGKTAQRRPKRQQLSFQSIRLSPAHSILQDVFGYEQFRGPQQAIVEHVIAGGDALVLMPTGGGKSLCYQVPAIVRQRARAWPSWCRR